jgi:hypothetical protein
MDLAATRTGRFRARRRFSPRFLTVIKDVRKTNNDDTTSTDAFTFSATSPTVNNAAEVPTPFSLWDDGTANDATQPDRRSYNLTLFGSTIASP